MCKLCYYSLWLICKPNLKCLAQFVPKEGQGLKIKQNGLCDLNDARPFMGKVVCHVRIRT